jgi:hypothetical protein
MAYGQADMQFIHETTDVAEDIEVWDNIPLDDTIVPTDEFMSLYEKNCKVFELGQEAGRRTVIDLFLREVVSLFSQLMIVCEYHMTLINNTKKRRLNGKCDYTICHRGFRKLPHLVAIEAKTANKDKTLRQCYGECASIYYRRKEDNMRNRCVYGIHSTGSSWYFIFVDENGTISQSQEYPLNVKHYVKEEVILIYRLVHYVVHQSFLNSERTTPNTSTTSL